MSSVSVSGLNSPCVAIPCIRDSRIANCQRYAPTEIWWISFTESQGQLALIPRPHISRTVRKGGTPSSEAPYEHSFGPLHQ